MKLNFSLDTAVIVTLISVLLYMVGQVYLSSFLRPFGAEISVLNFSIQDKLYYGYLKAVTHSIILVLIAIIFFIAIPLFYKGLGIDIYLKKFFKKLNSKFIQKKTHTRPIHNSSLEAKFEKSINYKIYFFYSILGFLISSLFYLAYIEKNTEKDAAEYLNNYSEKLTEIKLTKPFNGRAFEIMCGQSNCAVLIEDKNAIELHYVDPKEIIIPSKNLRIRK